VQPQPGQVVAEKLRLTRQLGSGGMGSVWVADHLTLKTQVAVKFMAAELAGNADALARFSREAAAAARIKSPHVVRVFDYGVSEGTPYMVLELLEGEDLASLLRRRGALDPREAAEIVSQAAQALEQAHAQGIVHRDIKPGNIFLSPSGGEVFVRLLDFGVAKAPELEFSTKTVTGATLGTPYYMSPEQVFAKGPVDASADVWALAVVAYECITGVLPFEGDTLAALGVAHNSGKFRPPSTFRRLGSANLDAWFFRAFAVERSARFPSARELAETLKAVTGGLAPPSGGVRVRTDGARVAKTGFGGPTLLSSSPMRSPARRAAPFVAGAAAILVIAGLIVVLRYLPQGGGATGAATTDAGPPATAAPTNDGSAAPSPSASAPRSLPSGAPTGIPASSGRPRRRDRGF
jgi:serine/threonine-protein kinase